MPAKNETISITVVGHSLGAALATINALDIVTNGYNVPTGHPKKACLVTAFPFASPKVGDENFRKKFSSSEKLRALRVTNAIDIVPSSLQADITTSLETYLHLIAGTKGIDSKDFDLGGRRGIALVNKGKDALNDDCKIPAQWWVAKNKNMVQNGNDGSWSSAAPYIPPPPEDDKKK
ncbi:hypothetical protein NL676_008327 [Syzygium grande]|nr:hypothetical protein NL676_008327 [Syzygium grande]